MSTLRTLKQLVLGETWLLPIGVAAVVAGSGLVLQTLLQTHWRHLGGFVILAGIVGVFLACVGRTTRTRT
jgi:RsiW-degrading membrane proteinase PrsW (M82 family)